jgi:hypothetical protein
VYIVLFIYLLQYLKTIRLFHRCVCKYTFNFRLIPNLFLTIFIFSMFTGVTEGREAALKFSFWGLGAVVMSPSIVSSKTLCPSFVALKYKKNGAYTLAFWGAFGDLLRGFFRDVVNKANGTGYNVGTSGRDAERSGALWDGVNGVRGKRQKVGTGHGKGTPHPLF